MEPDDRQLLLQTHRGHEPSARLLWERHAPRMLAHAGAILGAGNAEDAVQSAFCRVLSLKRRDLRAVADIPAFLATVTRRIAINTLRESKRRRKREENLRHQPVPHPRAADDSLLAALDQLPRRSREIIALKHASGLTFDQIAIALGVNRNTTVSRYRAALDALRLALEPDFPPSPRPRPRSASRSPEQEVACG